MRSEYFILKSALRERLPDIPWAYSTSIFDAEGVAAYSVTQTFPEILDSFPEFFSPVSSPVSREFKRPAAFEIQSSNPLQRRCLQHRISCAGQKSPHLHGLSLLPTSRCPRCWSSLALQRARPCTGRADLSKTRRPALCACRRPGPGRRADGPLPAIAAICGGHSESQLPSGDIRARGAADARQCMLIIPLKLMPNNWVFVGPRLTGDSWCRGMS